MERLIYRKFKGLEVRCLKCNKSIHKDNSPKNGCKHPIERTAYRGIVWTPNTKSKRTGITLNARTYDAAVKELIDYRNDIYAGKNIVPKEEIKPQLLIDCMAMYVDHLSNGTENSAKTNSKGHITSMNSHYRNFIKFIETQGFNENNCRITDIDANMAGKYDLYLQGITQSAYTFNHSVKAMRSLMKFLIESNGYQITNHFLKIRLEEENSTNSTITREDFQQLLSCISSKDSIQIDKKGRKRNMYREWLIHAIKLKAYTGRRNEEIFKMRWSDIVYEQNRPIYIVTNNLKSVRLKKNQRFSKSKILLIPIIQELEKFLCEIGMNEKRGSNDYIIAPLEKASRTNMQELASKSFTFFAKKLSREYNVKMKQLRSTYITAQEIYSYKQGPKLKQHANFATTQKHYINEIEIVKYITKDRSRKRFKVFE